MSKEDGRQRSLEEIGLGGSSSEDVRLDEVTLRASGPSVLGVGATDPQAQEPARAAFSGRRSEDRSPAGAAHEDAWAAGEESVSGESARFGDRVLAAIGDGVVYIGVVALAVMGMSALGIEPGLQHWPGLALLVLAFSFLYVTLPLAFWGQTAGMAWRCIRAKDAGGDALSFSQAAALWLLGWLSALLLGLPLLSAIGGGRSVSERLVGSVLERAYD